MAKRRRFGPDAGEGTRIARARARLRTFVASGRSPCAGTQHVGFVLRLPLCRNGTATDCRAAPPCLSGSIVSSYRMSRLMQVVLTEQLLRQVRLSIHDAGFVGSPATPAPPTTENLLFDNGPLLSSASAQPGPSLANDENASFSKTLTRDVGGRRWNIYFTARQDFAAPFDRWQPLVILLGGSASPCCCSG